MAQGRVRVEREITLPVPLAEVWEAIVDGDRLGAWLGGGSDLDVDLDVEPGATGTVVEADESARHVRVETVDPRRRVRFHWWPEDGSGPLTEVDLGLTEVDGGTCLRVIETVVAPAPFDTAPLDATHFDSGADRPERRGRLGFQLRARVLVDA